MLEHLNSLQIVADISLTDRVAEWSVKIMETLGGPGAALLIALENLFPPIPSEVILPLAGFTASQGNLGYISSIFWTTSGSLIGALLLYQLGAWLGRDRIRHYAGKLPLIKIKDINKAESWFTKHENEAVFFGRMIPVVRSLISIPAGVEKMKLKIFIIYTALGSLIWNTALITAGYLLGEQWHLVGKYVDMFKYFIVFVAALLIGWFIYKRLQKHKKSS